MYKLYKRDGRVLNYHEVWEEDGSVIEHFGIAGTRGSFHRHPIPAGADEDKIMETLLEPAAKSGFEEIAEDELIRLHVVVPRPEIVGDADLEKRHEIEDRMDDLLGETGVGHCDGGSMQEKTMEIFCFVADEEIAKGVIRADFDEEDLIDLRRK